MTKIEIEHQQLVSRLKKPGEQILVSTTALECDINHMIFGIVGEVGELVDVLKKHTIYRKPLDLDHVIEEMGDLEFYLEGLRQALIITREETLKANTEKLNVRYNSGTYSDKQAQERADKAQNDVNGNY